MPSGWLAYVDFSGNDLTDVAVEAVVDLILSESRPVKRLKFFSNRLCEPLAICRLLEDKTCGLGVFGGPQELHLSHNNLSSAVVEQLLECLLVFKLESGAPVRPPFWIRAERNGLQPAGEELVDLMGKRGLDVCLVERARREEADPFADVHLYVSA